ncbi:MAG: hypothetical protein ACI959_001945 [Limisphaerales bacterium]|jgi:hypothetical protein
MSKQDGIEQGPMMSSPGLRYIGKVFAFYYNKDKDKEGSMVLKLGETFDPLSFGLLNYSIINTFKKKAPLAGWYVVSEDTQWELLAELALEKIILDIC